MAWDRTTNPLITRTRLRLCSPDHVYQALEEYGTYMRDHPYSAEEDESLEQALAGRNDRLIDLALAKNATTHSLVAQLYKQALTGSGDADYDRAIRLASLSNRIAVGMLNSEELKGTTEERTDSELYRLAMEGAVDELTTLLRNPGSRGLLRAVYAREAPLDVIPDDRWRLLVYSSVGNPGLNRDDSSNSGPDLLAWDIHKALFKLLVTAPAEPQWVTNLHQLFLEVSPSHTRADTEQALLETLERWKGLKVKKLYSSNDEAHGFFTPVPIAEEFRCLIAALYGRVLANTKFVYVGNPDADDVALRAAYYGCSELKVADMRAGHEKDGEVFTFAALFNDSLMLKNECRAELEGYLTGDMQWLYTKRCTQLQKQHRWFDARPVSESMDLEGAGSSGPAHPELQDLSGQVTELKTRLANLSKTAFWGLVVLAILVVWHR